MQGHRREDLYEDAEGWSPMCENVQHGDFWKLTLRDGTVEWYACCPNGFLGNLTDHEVQENEDGTITVSPSILTWREKDGAREEYHGYLRAGVWSNA